jgi:transcriptional regulator with XRE-family HTH domain
MTQEQVAGKLGLSRASVAQMELGNRQVTSLELDRMAYLYSQDIRVFLSEQFDARDALTVMLRANPDLGRDGQVAESLRRCIALGRALSDLENLGLVNDDQREALQDDIDRGLDKCAAEALGLDALACDANQATWEFKHRFLSLGLEAYRRELISEAKLRELAGLVGVPAEGVLSLLPE